MVRVKICGITNMADAAAAVAAGADALGFVFHGASPRCVLPALVSEISRRLPPFVTRIGVFVDSPLPTVEEIMSYCHLDFAQLHGGEDAAFCAALYPRAIKSLRVGRDDVLAALPRFTVAAFVLDTYRPGLAGGTGATFDWSIARQAAAFDCPIILSGGLHPDNVAEAIAAAQPFAVDVASGVEASPGQKDHAKLRAFIAAAKAAGNV